MRAPFFFSSQFDGEGILDRVGCSAPSVTATLLYTSEPGVSVG